MTEKSFANDLYTYIRAGFPIINILSAEEDRVLDRINEILDDKKLWKSPRRLFIWSISRGFVDINGKKVEGIKDTSPESSLTYVARFKEPAIFLFKDFNPYMKDEYRNASLVIRLIRDMIGRLKESGKCMLWVSPVIYLPPELEKEVTVTEMPFPEEKEYRIYLEELIKSVQENPRIMIDLDEQGKDKLVKACQGLTKCEMENALAKTIVGRGRLTGNDVNTILSEKEQIIRKSGILEYTASVESFGSIGGLGNLKNWLRQRNSGFTEKARKFGLPYPRGVMLVGVPGCGKSLCAKAVAAEWQMPLLKFDLSRVFQSKVGESEENMRKALSVSEGVAPAILWIDELEKGLAGMGGGMSDGGVSTRVFGTLLTWMEEKKKPVFVVATGNNIDKLPPELLRKGRIDEIFFVDLPTPRERAEILMIHISKNQRDPAQFDIPAIVHKTNGFNGVELEEVIKSGLYEAFDQDGKELETAHLLKAAESIVPLSISRKNDIDRLRRWAAENCRMAATPPEQAEEKAETDSLSERRARLIDF